MPFLAVYEHLWPVYVAMSRKYEAALNAARKTPYKGPRSGANNTRGGKRGASSRAQTVPVDEEDDEDEDELADDIDDDATDEIYDRINLPSLYLFDGDVEMEGEGDEADGEDADTDADEGRDRNSEGYKGEDEGDVDQLNTEEPEGVATNVNVDGVNEAGRRDLPENAAAAEQGSSKAVDAQGDVDKDAAGNRIGQAANDEVSIRLSRWMGNT